MRRLLMGVAVQRTRNPLIPPRSAPAVDLTDVQRVDRATWRRYLFYVDLVVMAIFAISLMLLVRHTFVAGQMRAREELSIVTQMLWLVVADTAFLVGSLMWIFFRFFRNQYIVLTKRY